MLRPIRIKRELPQTIMSIPEARGNRNGRKTALEAGPRAHRRSEPHAFRAPGDLRLEARIQRLSGLLPLDDRAPRAVLGLAVEVRERAREREGQAGPRVLGAPVGRPTVPGTAAGPPREISPPARRPPLPAGSP